MKRNEFVNRFKSNQEGSVIVIVALFMTIIIGISALALDLGLAFNKKAELQKDLDSIALAAVKELPATSADSNWDKAVEVAIKYAELNGVTGFSASNIVPVENSEKTKIIGMTVTGDVDVSYNFASVFGYASGKAGADSTAEVRTVDGGMTGLLPFVIDYQSMLKIQGGTVSLITIKADADGEIADPDSEFGNGWFGPVDIDRNGSSSASDYSAAVANGSTVPLDIGDTLNLVSGNKVGPTADGFNIRFKNHFDCTYNSATKTASCGGSCPRICTVPVVTIHMTDDGKKVDYLEVKSFASIFVELEDAYYDDKKEEIKLTGNEGVIKVTFIKETLVPTATVGDINDADNFGVYSPRLTN